ncbi:hypothetical protein GGX14DRAFT_563083 [Mycena pura]|uniref:F-box domain-containing protein n=1 Tax=Mycena pura TaxID=153505 RepID=A0AAD6VNV1_9AGAR|nr:hypothetical protein GGX14DRAFT_563083 [Mycena pura]
MTQLSPTPTALPAKQPAADNTGSKGSTTIHNHITNHSTNIDLTPLTQALNAFARSMRQCAYPQLIVACRGQKAAFSRAAIRNMGHDRATELFVERFARPEDYVEVPPEARRSGWFSSGVRQHAPAVAYLATFCRVEEGAGSEAPITLDSSGWEDNIGNTMSSITTCPTEILVEIFSNCRWMDPRVWTPDPISPECWWQEAQDALRRIAGGHLVAFAQVCARWRAIVEDTPTLWTMLEIDMRCWSLPAPHVSYTHDTHDWMVWLLWRALERGKGAPLAIEVVSLGGAFPPHTLQLLAACAPRWQRARFTMAGEMYKHLAAVAGRLPRLAALSVHVLDGADEPLAGAMQAFSDVPHLCSLRYAGSAPLSVMSPLPLEQLEAGMYSVETLDLVTLVAQMARLPPSALLRIQMDLDTFDAALFQHIPRAISHIEELNFAAMGPCDPHVAEHALTALFNAVTLPGLLTLSLAAAPPASEALPWPARAARAMFARSGSRLTLESLNLAYVLIGEAALVELLTDLPALKYLFVGDHPRALVPLITDSLLRRLQLPPEDCGACLVPALEALDLWTVGTFTDAVLVQLVRQRLPAHPFELGLLWAPGHVRELHSGVAATLSGWEDGGDLCWDCFEYNPNEDVQY